MYRKRALFPITIVIIAIIIASGIWFARVEKQQKEIDIPKRETLNISPITKLDHIQGNPDADVLIIEYSDFECPYCKLFHTTMERIVNEYGKSGDVAWVYRHFPIIEKENDLSYGAAHASECVFELGGESLFWNFTSQVFENIPSSLQPASLLSIAENIGINADDFQACMLLQKHESRIDRDLKDGMKLAEVDKDFGTPYIIIMSKSGIQTRISGNESYQSLKQIIETIK